MSHLSNSNTQQLIEKRLKDLLGRESHLTEVTDEWDEVARAHDLDEPWTKIVPDVLWVDNLGGYIIAEIYTRIESMKPGSTRKIATDVLKLGSLRLALGARRHAQKFKFMMIVPEELVSKLTNKGWLAQAARIHEVQIVPIKLNEDEHALLRQAVSDQREGMKK